MQNILLASTLHDPHGALLKPLSQAAEVVLSNYRGWVFNITTATDPRIKELLKSLKERGVYITESDSTDPFVSNKVENDHLNVLREALSIAKELGINKIQYTDWDRIIVAAKYFPEDLSEMAKVASDIGDTGSYLNFRRSPEDYFTHHPPLVQTELEFNRLYSKVFGIPIDIGSTAHVMSLDVLEEVIRRSPDMESVSFPHPKWLIIAKEMGAEIASVEIHHVLTFETPEQYKTQVSEEVAEGKFDKLIEEEERKAQKSTLKVSDIEGNYSLLQQAYMATFGMESVKNSKEWELRFTTERQYIELLQNHLDIFGFSKQKRVTLQLELQRSLSQMEGWRKLVDRGSSRGWQIVIDELLEQRGGGPER